LYNKYTGIGCSTSCSLTIQYKSLVKDNQIYVTCLLSWYINNFSCAVSIVAQTYSYSNFEGMVYFFPSIISILLLLKNLIRWTKPSVMPSFEGSLKSLDRYFIFPVFFQVTCYPSKALYLWLLSWRISNSLDFTTRQEEFSKYWDLKKALIKNILKMLYYAVSPGFFYGDKYGLYIKIKTKSYYKTKWMRVSFLIPYRKLIIHLQIHWYFKNFKKANKRW